MGRVLMTVVGMLALALGTTGCCPCPKEVRLPPPPEPVSITEQVTALNNRAAAIEGLKARGRVKVTWTDADGRHSQEADGVMLLRQLITPGRVPTADLVLIGRAFGDDVFELGSNQEYHWMAIRADLKRATVGRIGGPGEKNIPFRAAEVVRLLGVSPLYEIRAPGAPSGQRLVMTVRDQEPAVNELLVVRTPGTQQAYVERALLINRRTGLVDEVRMYRPDGTLEARATLANYKPAEWDDETPAAQRRTVQLPTRIDIAYPAAQAEVRLSLDNLTLMPALAEQDARFAMPDFAGQGLTVIDADLPAPATQP